MTVTNNRIHKDGTRSIEMQGLFHTITFMPTFSDYDPLLVQIERGTETSSALLEQEDIDALHEFLSHYISKPNTTCEHAEEMLETYKDYDGPLYGEHCGEWVPHRFHDSCMGVMCDYGCNAEEF